MTVTVVSRLTLLQLEIASASGYCMLATTTSLD